ncbi:MAG: dihydrodipicolinate reductase C-terminal domain-containing protein [Candidatus Saccharibacteria bacterium]|nr:dihydrodipicolinate reductase C-terminal domain-containing protein [Candidatus Saccharibacteria bacterium]
MLNIQIIGERNSNPSPNHMAVTISGASMETPTVMAYPITEQTRRDWDVTGQGNNVDCYVYTRSNSDRLPEAVSRSNDNDVPLVIVATGLELDALDELQTLGIIAPNTSMTVLNALRACLGYSNPDLSSVEIEDHHQETKRDVSGTALLLAQRLQLVHNNLGVEIKKFRDRNLSRSRFEEVPVAGHFAGHIVRFLGSNGDLLNEERMFVLGRREYSFGALSVAQYASEAYKEGAKGITHIFDIKDQIRPVQTSKVTPYETDVCYCGYNH